MINLIYLYTYESCRSFFFDKLKRKMCQQNRTKGEYSNFLKNTLIYIVLLINVLTK